jgi:hypothetical protein
LIYEPVKARIDEKDKNENKLQHILTGKAILKKTYKKHLHVLMKILVKITRIVPDKSIFG